MVVNEPYMNELPGPMYFDDKKEEAYTTSSFPYYGGIVCFRPNRLLGMG